MKIINSEELEKLIANVVDKNMQLNPELFDDTAKASLIIQLTVGSTLKVLNELGLISISTPKN